MGLRSKFLGKADEHGNREGFFKHTLHTGKEAIKNTVCNTGYAADVIRLKDKVGRERFACESKGFKRVGFFEEGSKELKKATTNYKEKGYRVQGIGFRGAGKKFVLLFIKKEARKTKVITYGSSQKTRKTRKVKVPTRTLVTTKQKWGLPAAKQINGKNYFIAGRFPIEEKEDAENYAYTYREQGYKTRIQKLTDSFGERKLAVYALRATKRIVVN